jgi:uncharacterized protein YcaQ
VHSTVSMANKTSLDQWVMEHMHGRRYPWLEQSQFVGVSCHRTSLQRRNFERVHDKAHQLYELWKSEPPQSYVATPKRHGYGLARIGSFQLERLQHSWRMISTALFEHTNTRANINKVTKHWQLTSQVPMEGPIKRPTYAISNQGIESMWV